MLGRACAKCSWAVKSRSLGSRLQVGADYGRRLASSASPNPEVPNPEDEQPPGAFATISLMGFGAVGAICVAGLGVLAVFQIANIVAAGTGRSMIAGKGNAIPNPDTDNKSSRQEALEKHAQSR